MTRKRPVGSAELATLTALMLDGGSWTNTDRPLWESRYWTLRLLAQLAVKGLVDEVIPDVRYDLSTDGMKYLSWGQSPIRAAKSEE